MKIVNEKPPIFDKIIAAGMSPSLDSTIFTYGDIIYNPSGQPIPDHLIAHEATHTKQQGEFPKTWWGKYLSDEKFRFEQEAEAYANQYAFICKTVKDRNIRVKILYELARILAGPTYGNIITRTKAMELIKQKL